MAKAKPKKRVPRVARPAVKAKARAKAKPAVKAKARAKAKPASKIKHAAQGKPAPKSKVGTLRGSGLVELAIAADRERRSPMHPTRPMVPKLIGKLAMPDGRPLPPSLATYLAYDAGGLDVLEGTANAPRLKWRTFAEMMREQFDEQTAAMYADFAKVLTGKCLVLPGGTDSRRFLYAGEPDAHGEYPVFVVDTDELPWVGLAYPGFDVYIADGRIANVIADTYLDGWSHQAYAPMLADHARRNFRGFRSLDYQEPDHLDGDDAARAAMGEVFGDSSPEDLEEMF